MCYVSWIFYVKPNYGDEDFGCLEYLRIGSVLKTEIIYLINKERLHKTLGRFFRRDLALIDKVNLRSRGILFLLRILYLKLTNIIQINAELHSPTGHIDYTLVSSMNAF